MPDQPLAKQGLIRLAQGSQFFLHPDKEALQRRQALLPQPLQGQQPLFDGIIQIMGGKGRFVSQVNNLALQSGLGRRPKFLRDQRVIKVGRVPGQTLPGLEGEIQTVEPGVAVLQFIHHA